jgi:hypothetical protein
MRRKNTADSVGAQDACVDRQAQQGCHPRYAGKARRTSPGRWPKPGRAGFPRPSAAMAASPKHRSRPRRPAFARTAAVLNLLDLVRFACSQAYVAIRGLGQAKALIWIEGRFQTSSTETPNRRDQYNKRGRRGNPGSQAIPATKTKRKIGRYGISHETDHPRAIRRWVHGGPHRVSRSR